MESSSTSMPNCATLTLSDAKPGNAQELPALQQEASGDAETASAQICSTSKDSRRACGSCGESKRERDFSRSAWRGGEGRRCTACVNSSLQELMANESEDTDDCTEDEEDDLRAVMALVASDGTIDDHGYNAEDVEALGEQGVDPWEEEAGDLISNLHGEYAGVYDDYDDDEGYPDDEVGFPGFEECDGFSGSESEGNRDDDY